MLILTVSVLAAGGRSLAAAGQPPSYIGTVNVPTVRAGPSIDGTLSDPAWRQAAVVHLGYDLRSHSSAPEKTTDYVMTDGANLYVGIDARQSIPVRAVQHSNNVGQDTDDEVQIDLWPNGSRGFRYLFISTALGTHYQVSSENSIYEPQWTSAGKIDQGGYTVTMKIPLDIMHASGGASWRVQFARLVMATNSDLVWSYGPAQQNHNDVTYSGTANGLRQLEGFRPKPRVGVYVLGSIASESAGGSTSRAGVDLSIPVTSGTSFVATLHPDYSNVEVDQQTIAPTAYQRIYNEVRPFFTQGANFYNTTPNCPDCPGTQLYTPNIPTPRQGYAIEGQHGLFTYAAFDAVGAGRTDHSQVVNYVSPDQKNLATVQRDAVNYPGLADYSVNVSYTHDNLKNFSTWLRYADDSGTNVLAGNRAQRYETGMNFYTPTSSVQVGLRKVGEYFNPVDGLIFHPDIAGYYVTGSKQYKYAPGSPIKEFDLTGNIDRFQGHTAGLNQSDSSINFSATTKRLFNVQVGIGSSYLLLSNNILSPITQQGFQLSYDYSSATPTTFGLNTGRFGPGRVNSWTRISTIRAGARAAFTVEADDTQQWLDAGPEYTQWLERASLAYQISQESSFALGVRRIIGIAPVLDTAPLYQSGWNISAAFHRLSGYGELYVAYGDAATFSTVPQFIVKYIRYVGAGKGT